MLVFGVSIVVHYCDYFALFSAGYFRLLSPRDEPSYSCCGMHSGVLFASIAFHCGVVIYYIYLSCLIWALTSSHFFLLLLNAQLIL